MEVNWQSNVPKMNLVVPVPYELPIASKEVLGGVKIDGDTITITEDGVLEISTNSVEYTPQTLTDAQKAQARENIGAEEKYGGLRKVDLYYGKKNFSLYIEEGSIFQYPDDATDEIKRGFATFYLFLNNGAYTSWIIAKNDAKSLWLLNNAGLITDEFVAYGFPNATMPKVTYKKYSETSVYIYFVFSNGDKVSYGYNPSTDSFSEYGTYTKILTSTPKQGKPSTQPQVLSQLEMSADPTTDMQIATKKYVDDNKTTVPTTYIKSASVSNNILTLTDASGTNIEFTGSSTIDLSSYSNTMEVQAMIDAAI